jgi:hypothetical protein
MDLGLHLKLTSHHTNQRTIRSPAGERVGIARVHDAERKWEWRVHSSQSLREIAMADDDAASVATPGVLNLGGSSGDQGRIVRADETESPAGNPEPRAACLSRAGSAP